MKWGKKQDPVLIIFTFCAIFN